MPSKLRPTLWFPIKGINLSDSPQSIPMDMAGDAYDCYVEESSILRKRDGYDEVNATAVSAAPSLTSLGSLYLSNGTQHELIGTDNGGVWQEVTGTVTTNVFQSGTFSVTQPIDYTQFLDTMLLVDGVTSVRSWDGTSTGTVSAAASAAKYGETHLNKFFLTGIVGALSRVDYSATGDFNTWSGAGTDQFQVDQNDGEIVKGLKSFSSNELLIWKDSSMWKLIGNSYTNFTLISVDKSIGCISNRTCEVFRNTAIWAGREGLYVYDGTFPRKMSQLIQPLWDTLNLEVAENFDSCIDEDRGLYIISVATGDNVENDLVLVVDLLHPFQTEDGFHFPIYPWRISSQSIHNELDSTNTRKLVFGDNVGFKMNLSTDYLSDNGTAIESYIETPLMIFGDGLGVSDALRRIYVGLESTNGSIDVSTEIKDGGQWVLQETLDTGAAADRIGIDFQINVSAVGATTVSGTFRINVKARSRRIKVRFLNNSTDEKYSIQSPVEFWTKPGGQRA